MLQVLNFLGITVDVVFEVLVFTRICDSLGYTTLGLGLPY